jgi:hypothetical protein
MSGHEERYFQNPYPDFSHSNLPPEIQKIVRTDFWAQFMIETGFVCMNKLKASLKYSDGTVYTGNLGLIFMAYKMLKSKYVLGSKYESEIKKYMLECLKSNEERLNTSGSRGGKTVAFLVGDGGLYIMACLVYRVLGDEANVAKYANAYASMAQICQPIDFLPKGSDELFVGRAGYLW